MALYVLHVNPEPWAIGPLQVGRRGGKAFPSVGRNAQLAAFQDAVREAFASDYPSASMVEGAVKLRFWFWRRRDSYETASGRRHRKHQADVTNLQKGLEDALQGVLFKNDNQVNHVESVLVWQGDDVRPCIVIEITQSHDIGYAPLHVLEAARLSWEKVRDAQAKASDNTWGGPDGA